MATSNANTSVPPSEDAKLFATGKTYDKALVTPTMDNGPQEKPISQMRYNYRWRITFPAQDDTEITPRTKFTMILSMIRQFWPSTVLNTWLDEDSLQGLTNGKHLLYLQNDLEVYCPHVKQKNRLKSSWNITSKVKLDTMKENRAFMRHLNVNNIFNNVTRLTTSKRDLWVWCALSHLNQTCWDKVVEELNSCLSISRAVELNQYLTKGKRSKTKTSTARSLVVAGGNKDKKDGIKQLLLLNNLTQDKKDQFPYTGHWFFVLFHSTRAITQEMILGMMENQNYFLENQESITVQGLTDIKTFVEDPDFIPTEKKQCNHGRGRFSNNYAHCLDSKETSS
eukprot:15343182-Ditylum_brightwellii.AAC.2